jgi:hypothetical protein
MTHVDLSAGLYEQAEFERQLELELRVATVRETDYAIIVAVPQHLPGEGVADVVRTAAHCVENLIRDGDIAGHLDDDVLAVGLQNRDRVNADALAFRMQGDLRLASQHLRNTNWEVGVACLPDDGSTMEELLSAAIAAARNRRRNFAAQVPAYPIQIPPALGEFGRL